MGTDYLVTSQYLSLYFLKIIWIIVFKLPYRKNFAFQTYCNLLRNWGVRAVIALCCALPGLGTISFQIVQVINVFRIYKFTKILVSGEEQKCIYKCTQTSP